MPELPEVETVRQTLLPEVIGHFIVMTYILTPGVLLNPAQLDISLHPETDLSQCLPGCHLPDSSRSCVKADHQARWKIAGLERRGKYLIIRLADIAAAKPFHACLLVHLRMTGRLLLKNHHERPPRHTHVRFLLNASDQNEMCHTPADDHTKVLDFHDTRRFGRIWLLPEDINGKLVGAPSGFYCLGPEPLEASFTSAVFKAHLERRQKTPVKSALLDQKVVAGLGNIYADEALFRAGIQPQRRISSLSVHEIKKLHRAIIEVLHEAIACQGTTLRDYVDGWNRKGRFQSCLMVYGRAGEPCRRCDKLIAKTVLAGRTTCFCPRCQN